MQNRNEKIKNTIQFIQFLAIVFLIIGFQTVMLVEIKESKLIFILAYLCIIFIDIFILKMYLINKRNYIELQKKIREYEKNNL